MILHATASTSLTAYHISLTSTVRDILYAPNVGRTVIWEWQFVEQVNISDSAYVAHEFIAFNHQFCDHLQFQGKPSALRVYIN